MTDEQHNKYIAYAFIANGSFYLLILMLMAAMFLFIFNIDDGSGQPKPPVGFLGVIFGVMALFYTAFAVPSFIAAWALLKQKSWARIASIIAGVIAAMNVPIGTAACVYSLWFFLGDQWKTVYQNDDAFPATSRGQIAYGKESQWDGHRMDEKGEVVYQHQEPPDWR